MPTQKNSKTPKTFWAQLTETDLVLRSIIKRCTQHFPVSAFPPHENSFQDCCCITDFLKENCFKGTKKHSEKIGSETYTETSQECKHLLTKILSNKIESVNFAVLCLITKIIAQSQENLAGTCVPMPALLETLLHTIQYIWFWSVVAHVYTRATRNICHVTCVSANA